MSLERAAVNCNRCYEIASMIAPHKQRMKLMEKIDKGWQGDTSDKSFPDSHQLYIENQKEMKKKLKGLRQKLCASNSLSGARNEAMRALEEEIGFPPGMDNVEYRGYRKKDAKNALKACLTCDYEHPRIGDEL